MRHYVRFHGRGLALEVNPVRARPQSEAAGVMQVTSQSKSDLVLHEGNDIVGWRYRSRITGYYTPGSQCFCVKDSLFAGDTLFLQGCGRVDLPGGDADEMYYTLTQRLSKLPDSMTLFPGHAYGGEHAPLGHVRQTNHQLQIPDIETWRRFY